METSKPDTNDLIVYFDINCVKHIGIVLDSEHIESKWGIGQLCKHKIFEVPAHYGEHVKYYKPISADAALDEFVNYAKENGVKFKENA